MSLLRRKPTRADTQATAPASSPAGARIDDSPSNPGYPANGWLLRHGFGFLNPYFPGSNAYTIQPGKPLKLRYTVTVFAGGVDPASLSR